MKRFYIVIIIVLLILLIPVIWWFLSPKTPLNVAIINKTVPDDSYREHMGITWVLNHERYVKENGNHYDATVDYDGFQLDMEEQTYDLSSLPTDYSEHDVIYLADTYGVYEEDLPWVELEREGTRSSKIDGGLTEKEWNAILERLDQDKTSLLIAEYNTFASPTEQKVRESVTDYLGVEWSGWTGRYFDELNPAENDEIPQWIVDRFQDDWKYEGGGFLLVNDFTAEVIVLEDEKHVKSNRMQVVFTTEGKEEFGLSKAASYQYWFDIVTPKNGAKALANYEWDVTKQGKQLLETNDIPVEFAAVLGNNHGMSKSYYFAGDYNDIGSISSFYQMKGIDTIYQSLQKYSDENFYWSIYVPMMKAILKGFVDMKADVEKDTNEQELADVTINAKVADNKYSVLQDGEWTPITIKGINIGMGKPGYYPGEAAITEEEYYRWFQHIGEMNANSVRVYTLHPPGFYHALKRYNEEHEEKIYLFHGAWMNEKKLEESLDAFEKENLQDFQEEMRTLIDVIHGNKIVEPKAGHASGTYRADVSEYVIGWILGIEWYPYMVLNTNETYDDIGEYEGTYFETKGATAFEHWLAAQMDLVAKYEKENYQTLRPMSFTNWVTTDLLEHPTEPNEVEDIVSVDPNVIYTKGDMDVPNQFASYHVYPYYPDFLNYEKRYLKYKDHRGEKNSYAAYLRDLHEAHRLPLLIAEFGIPGSRGLTHENPFGWNQGFQSEESQGEIIAHLFEDIMEEDLLGGLIFSWQDEWFKRTWNTVDYDNPDRRPFWSNAQTNEQQFGLLSFDRLKIKVDGNATDWKEDPLYTKDDGELRALYVDHDERYLYIRLDYEQDKAEGYPIFLLDLVPNQGNETIKEIPNIRFQNGLEYIINLKESESSLFVDQYYDFFTYQYGHTLKMLEKKPKKPTKNSGLFTTERYALNKALYFPNQDKTLPFSSYDTGKLIEGNGNPAYDAYNSLADYYVSEDGMIELRIPWLLIHAKDPSKKEFIGDIYKDGMEASEFVEEIYIGALYLDEEDQLLDSFPMIKDKKLDMLKGYTWDNWEQPLTEERLKQSYYIVQELFSKYDN